MPRKLSVQNSLSTGLMEFKSVRFDPPHEPDYFLPRNYLWILAAHFGCQLLLRAVSLFVFVAFWVWILGA